VIKFTSINAPAVIGTLNELNKCAQDLQPAMEAIGGILETEVALGFRASRDPWGEAWAPLKSRTIARRRRRSAQPLVDTGLLRSSVTTHATKRYLDVMIGRSDRPAGIHQFGGRAGRKLAANIPARPMLPIRAGGVIDLPPEWARAMEGVVRAHLTKSG
jgi:phage virion morphogenesis protein